MNKRKLRNNGLAIALMSSGLALGGCGGGGSDGPSAPAPVASITVQPGSFDFTTVTEGNLDAVPARRFTIRNTGSASYNLTSIRLEGANPADFALDTSAGSTPCGAAARSLAPGASCDVALSFAPRSFGDFGATLVVQSNDPVRPTLNAAVQGSYVEILDIDVQVSQINACPREVAASAFVSVTDQAGFPIKDLDAADFSLREAGADVGVDSAGTVAGSGGNISLSIMMDYSNTITRFPEVVASMDEAASILVRGMAANDEADIIKFSFNPKFMLNDFSSDQAALLAAVATDPQLPGGSRFYDATVAVIERLKVRTNERKAVIALTDGADSSDNTTLDGLIATTLVQDIPIYTVGLGNARALDLGKLAADTGGVFINPPSFDNLNAAYQQLASLLFDDQYVLRYTSGLAVGTPGTLEVTVEFTRDGKIFAGSGTKTVLDCPAL